MPLSRTALAAGLCACALTFAACGGDSDEDQINDVVSKIDEDPAAVCQADVGSKQLIEQLGGEEACKRAAEAEDDPNADETAEVQNLKIDGDNATATIKDGTQNQPVKFVKEDGDWKLAG